ncbi:unnamed protein product [Prunus armeniaca]|uniref:Pentacotripeptide-repeat region of PRORP domain-containing protein n=1 Tax=Prunus armeniaca TaxID=36596 RepID=A0A6J5WQ52_PRUAR|nr:hypothetical protein GBA52_010531 [Prunus armeniaca]CAB4303866.1 unnamed protein product [Prunus armeniaca]
MIKLLGSNPWHGNAISGVLRTLFYSTEALASCSPPFETLYHRISRAGNPRVSIVPVLDQWIEEGRDVNKSELQSFVKMLRKYRRYSHALQISEWMSDARNHDLSPGDIAIRLDLISKVCGLEQAEMYFNSLPDPLRNFKVYGALLFCSVEHKSLEKAENLFEKMKELGYVKGPLPYNVMLTLYSQLGQHEKLDILVKEMEEKVIDYDSFTLKIQLNLYANTSDIDRMEKLLMKIEADPLVTVDWNGYVVAAKGFLKAGLLEKASSMLRRSEQLVSNQTRTLAYEIFLSLYAAIGNKEEVYRIWNMYKFMARFKNSGYLCMLSSLVKLDDIDGAEMIVEEWDSGAKFFDIRIPNFLITTYCKKGLLVKAESYINKLEESGKPLDASTWTRLAAGYHMHGQMAKAVETMKRAILASQPGWELNHLILAACLEYLKEKGNLEVAHELLSLIRERDHFSEELCDKLEKYII